MVRPGIMLYGGLPHPSHAARAPVRPVMRFTTRIVQLKSVAPGGKVGYGHTFTAPRPMRVGVLPVGYADGYPRALSNAAEVLVRGRRAPVVGVVSMDHITIDVTDVPEVEAGDEVTLWGTTGESGIDVMELGTRAGTIGYELLTRVGRRVPRVYLAAEGAPA